MLRHGRVCLVRHEFHTELRLLVGAPGVQLEVLGQHETVLQAALDPLNGLREVAFAARHSQRFKRIGLILRQLDSKLPLIIHPPRVDIAPLR